MSVKIQTYVSPVYLHKEPSNSEDVERYNGEARPTTEDDFEEWLNNNSVSYRINVLNRLENCLIFDGRALCRVDTDRKTLKAQRGGMHPLSDYAYQLVVNLRSQPTEAGLPKELQEELKRKNYISEPEKSKPKQS